MHTSSEGVYPQRDPRQGDTEDLARVQGIGVLLLEQHGNDSRGDGNGMSNDVGKRRIAKGKCVDPAEGFQGRPASLDGSVVLGEWGKQDMDYGRQDRDVRWPGLPDCGKDLLQVDAVSLRGPEDQQSGRNRKSDEEDRGDCFQDRARDADILRVRPTRSNRAGELKASVQWRRESEGQDLTCQTKYHGALTLLVGRLLGT